MSDPSTKDNLARIRDNQRRSRARRKEYLQELEAKYRTCEQLGVQASAEIQAAAKRVLEENKRLRTLLHHKGVSDTEIDGFAGSDPSSISPSEALDTMLKTRRPCIPQPGCGSSTSCSSKSPNQQPPIAMPQLSTTMEPTPHQQLSPQSYVSTASMSSTLSTPTTMASPMVSAPPLQHFSPPDPTISTSTYDPTYAPYYGIAMQGNWGWPSVHDMSMDPTPHAPNTSSCVHAANIIRGMRNDLGPELEQDLGCNGSSQDCKVDNNVVFELVDKYAMRGL